MRAAGAAAGGTVAARAVGLEPQAGEGEERCTRGRQVRPPRVFTMLEPAKEKKWRGGLQKLETGCEMKRKVIKEGFIKGGGQMKGLGRLMALSSYLMAALEKKKFNSW